MTGVSDQHPISILSRQLFWRSQPREDRSYIGSALLNRVSDMCSDLPNDLFSFGTLGRSNLCYKLRTSPFIGLFRSSYLSRLLMHVFDELDRRLISVLREDGRAPISKDRKSVV